MGRSKFPGKPSKHVNKQRVNVLPYSSAAGKNNSVLIAQNIFIGVSVGQTSVPEEKNKGAPNDNGEATDSETTINQDFHSRETSNIETVSECRDKQVTNISGVVNLSACLQNRTKEINKCANVIDNKPSELVNNGKQETVSFAGKFILPQRSAHSSRVIKPNKRFVDSAPNKTNTQLNNSHPCTSLPRSQKKVKFVSWNLHNDNNTKIDNKILSTKSESKKDTAVTCFSERTLKNKADNKRTVRFIECPQYENSWLKNITEENEICKDGVERKGKLILRKAKLQLHPRGIASTNNHDGPFSSHVPPGAVTCGVCGAVRFYRFVKQARKFNIYSCESCRKFISKMIKRQVCFKAGNLSKLVCHKGQGVCHVPPIVRSQQWKLIRCAYKARCPACWLKMCLRSFKMPPQLKNNLAEMLPDNMQIQDALSTDNNLTLSSAWSKFVKNTFIGNGLMCRPPSSMSSNFPSLNKPVTSTSSSVTFCDSNAQNDYALSERSGRRMRIRKKVQKINYTVVADKSRRQKLDLKGPRVKHVCRSASIVLGQPVATFQTEAIEKKNVQIQSHNTNECSRHSELYCDDCKVETKIKISNNSLSNEYTAVDEKFIHSELDNTITTLATIDEDLNSMSNYYNRINTVPVSNSHQECYDRTDITTDGFGLIIRGSHKQALCFLCGSAGRDELIYCSYCCEPYHTYCMDNCITITGSMWICSRCTTGCSGCSLTDISSPAVACLLCKQLFHLQCINKTTMICSSCDKCSICNSEDTDQFIGNSQFCKTCFELTHKKLNCIFCDKGFHKDSKILECSLCKNWLHSFCDVTEEQWRMLRSSSLLSQYACRKCLNGNKSEKFSWRQKLSSRLLTGCLSILRSLAEHRVSNTFRTVKQLTKSANIKKDSGLNSSSSMSESGLNEIDSTTLLKQKYLLRECSVRVKDCSRDQLSLSEEIKSQESALEPSDSGIGSNDEELLTNAFASNSSTTSAFTFISNGCDTRVLEIKNCMCTDVLTLLEMKRKVISKDYQSLQQFRHDLELAIKGSGWNELLDLLQDIIVKVFPWYEDNLTSWCCAKDGEIVRTEEDERFDKCSIVESISRSVGNGQVCALCSVFGDVPGLSGGRLLYSDPDTWVHVACALWSVGVHETLDGAVLGVAATVRRAIVTQCSACKLRGATVDCSQRNCTSTYHFPCAKSAGCRFVHNYRVFCSQHVSQVENDKELLDEEFEVNRPVYICANLKKQLLTDFSKLQFVVGSLVIRNLGNYVPEFSDFEDAIIPSGLVCTRLFWSSVEPWKIVSYKISTYISNSVDDVVSENENNVTIDHSEDKTEVDKKLEDIKNWFRTLETDENEANSREETNSESEIDESDEDIANISQQVVNYLLDSVCSRDVEENEEEPQNSTDILPPEIKDAIFEDLPHDVLDGISMQDIFPKLMSYDDILNIDLRNESLFNDVIKDVREDCINIDDVSHFFKSKKSEETSEWSSIRESNFIKRNKSDNQKSCVTWSCKLSGAPIKKKRRLSCDEEPPPVPPRLLQVDGADDVFSSESETDEPTFPTIHRYPFSNDETDGIDEPVTCQRCHCTYRTPDSYRRHLTNCEAMSTTDSESDEQSESILVSEHRMAAGGSRAVETNVSDTQLNETAVHAIHSVPTELINFQQTHTTSTIDANFVSQSINHSTVSTPLCQNASNTTNNVETVGVNDHFIVNEHTKVISEIFTPEINTSNSNLLLETKQCFKVINNNVRGRGRPSRRPILSKQRRIEKPKNIIQQIPAIMQQANTIMIPQTQPMLQSKQTIYLQQMNTPNTLTYAPDPMQHQNLNLSTQNLPCIITPNIEYSVLNNSPQFVAINPIMSNTFQLHPSVDSVNVLGLSNGVVTAIPSPVMGTLVQPQQLAGAMMSTEQQVILAPTQSAPNCMYLGSQPIFYGLETVVQNTVMSQQFMSTVVPGILAQNSSFSATTQVFQTSTIEPVDCMVINQQNIMPVESQNFMTPTVQDVVTVSDPVVRKPVTQIIQQTHVPSQMQIPVNTQMPSMNPVTSLASTSVAMPTAIENSTSFNLQTPNFPPSTATSSAMYINHQPHISLPVAPAAHMTNIPMNVVQPTPQMKMISNRPLRPTNRVLPMTTTIVKLAKDESINEKDVIKSPEISNDTLKTNHINQETNFMKIIGQNDVDVPKSNKCAVKVHKIENEISLQKPSDRHIVSQENLNKDCEIYPVIKESTCSTDKENNINNYRIKKDSKLKLNLHSSSLKLVFQKQAQDGVYKISNKKMKQTNLSSNAAKFSSDDNCKTLPSDYILKPNDLNDNTKDIREIDLNKKTRSKKLKSSKPKNKSSHRKPKMMFKIESQDGFSYSTSSLNDLWLKVVEAVQASRIAHGMPALPKEVLEKMAGYQLLGLKNRNLRQLLDEMRRLALIDNSSINEAGSSTDITDGGSLGGAARCTEFNGQVAGHDMFSWLASRHRRLFFPLATDVEGASRRASSINLPMATRYRNLKELSKKSVGVYRSNIHGRGLFCLRDIELGEMVIEYAGEVIRSSMTDMREKYYNSKGIGCYMFRIDDNLVVDATVKGNSARFINHSCDPNCYSRVLDILGHKHILIFALRRILQGEELTYDYKFPFEEDKIPCTCGARRCRKYLN